MEALFCYQFYIGGDPTILDDRKTATDVTLAKLIEDINSSQDGYCFLRVLEDCLLQD